jgi:hypothetical protein
MWYIEVIGKELFKMFNKKVIFSIAAVSILAVVILLFSNDTGAISHQEASLLNNQAITKDVPLLPAEEPDEYKIPIQWENREGSHGLIRTANTVWQVKGIIESNQMVWDKFNVWSGPDENGKQVIATFAQPDSFNGQYNASYTCPNQTIGKIFITDVKDSLVFFKADSGNTGNFNLDTHVWNFD